MLVKGFFGEADVPLFYLNQLTMLYRLETIDEIKIISSKSTKVIKHMIDAYQSNDILLVHQFENEKQIIPIKSWDVKSFLNG